MAAERWRPVPGFPWYVASDMGRLRSLSHVGPTGRMVRGGPLKADRDQYGYPKVNAVDAMGRRRTLSVHRAVALAWCPNDDPEHKVEVDHVNGDHDDARACNLEWVTPEENMRRAWETMPDRITRRLTPEEVAQVRASEGRPHEVAARLGVTVSCVTDIRRGRTYREVGRGIE